MHHPMVMFVVQAELAERRAQADAVRFAQQSRTPRNKGLVASLVKSARSAFGSTDGRGATSPA
jgi:hypothetical protein